MNVLQNNTLYKRQENAVIEMGQLGSTICFGVEQQKRYLVYAAWHSEYKQINT